MVAFEEGKPTPIHLEISFMGDELEILDPVSVPKLGYFFDAMADFKKARNSGFRVTKRDQLVKSIEHKELKKHIGILSIKGHRKLEGTQLEIETQFLLCISTSSKQIYDKCP